MGAAIRTFCVSMLLSFMAGKACAQIEAVVHALPADRLYVAGITSSIAGYTTMTDIEKVRALRLYVYQHTPVGKPIIHDQTVNLPLNDAYALFAKAGGVMCAGTAILLSRVYKAAGFNSWVYNFGVIGGPTHMTTLVEVDGDVVLQDAYLDFEYVDDHGMPIRFLDLISRIVDGHPPTAKAEVANRVWLFDNLAQAEALVGPYKDVMSCEDKAAALSCSAIITLSRFLEGTDISDFLELRGWPGQVEYLMLYPIGLVSMYSDTVAQGKSLLDDINRKIRDLPLDIRLKMHGLPSIDTLTKGNIDIFMKQEVPEDLRMLALSKLRTP